MIDYDRLYRDYDDDKIYALQLEVGDKCFQGCIYCYMNAVDEERNTLTNENIKHILIDAKKLEISAIEWLGGEPLIRDSIFKHMKYSHDLGFRNNIWTGGLPLSNEEILLNTAKYADPGLISIHVSTIDPLVYEKLHPNRTRKDLEIMIKALEKLIDIGYSADDILNSVTFTGLQTSGDMIKTIDFFEDKFGVKTSLNVYHTYLRPEISDNELSRFIPDRKEVAKVYKHYARNYNVEQLPMNCVNKQYCSATVAVLCDGSITPCATIRIKQAPNIHTDGSFYDLVNDYRDYLIFKKLKDKNNLNEDCKSCSLSDECFGCRSRSFAAGNGLYGKDPRCFRNKN